MLITRGSCKAIYKVFSNFAAIETQKCMGNCKTWNMEWNGGMERRTAKSQPNFTRDTGSA